MSIFVLESFHISFHNGSLACILLYRWYDILVSFHMWFLFCIQCGILSSFHMSILSCMRFHNVPSFHIRILLCKLFYILVLRTFGMTFRILSCILLRNICALFDILCWSSYQACSNGHPYTSCMASFCSIVVELCGILGQYNSYTFPLAHYGILVHLCRNIFLLESFHTFCRSDSLAYILHGKWCDILASSRMLLPSCRRFHNVVSFLRCTLLCKWYGTHLCRRFHKLFQLLERIFWCNNFGIHTCFLLSKG